MDDPDGTLVLHQLQEQVSDRKFEHIRDDIFAIRAPPSGSSRRRAACCKAAADH